MTTNDTSDDHPALDHLADAITRLAGARNTIGTHHLMYDTAINIVILTRIATQRIQDRAQRHTIDELANELAAALRRAGNESTPA